jgi:hypothetical protein
MGRKGQETSELHGLDLNALTHLFLMRESRDKGHSFGSIVA